MSTELQTTNGAGISTWQPQSLNEAMKLADYVSKSGLVPDALRGKASDTLLVMMKGRELGLSVMQSLAGIHVIKGQTQLSAATMRALVVSRRDVCKYFRIIEQSNQGCTVETWRIGNPEADRASFSIEDAKQAGLTSNPNWSKYPADMLLARATSRLCRAIYPDLVAGVYVEGELEEDAPVERGSAAAEIASRLDPQKQVAQPAQAEAEVIDAPSAADLAELRQLVSQRAKQMGQKPREFGAALLEGYGVQAVEQLDAAQVIDALAALRDRIENHEADAALAAE